MQQEKIEDHGIGLADIALAEKYAAIFLGISVSVLKRLRDTPHGPEFFEEGDGNFSYPCPELARWHLNAVLGIPPNA